MDTVWIDGLAQSLHQIKIFEAKMDGNKSSGESSCPDSVSEEFLRQHRVILIFILLGTINVLVILGNSLVIIAVKTTPKLQTITNYFIVSLAVADLLVGLTTLPFSTASEVLKVWIFGKTWCQIWLTVDVWLSTSSIINLCAISYDRYIAVMKPVKYPSHMTDSRAKIVIAGVWIVSFLICFPPLVGWKDRDMITPDSSPSEEYVLVLNITDVSRSFNMTDLGVNNYSSPILQPFSNSSIKNQTHLSQGNRTICSRKNCLLNNSVGYRIYSAIGSFYIPMLIMVFFYCRIYNRAMATHRAMIKGFITTKYPRNGRMSEQRMTLRVHRGRSSYNTNNQQEYDKNSLNVHTDNGKLESGISPTQSRADSFRHLLRTSTKREHHNNTRQLSLKEKDDSSRPRLSSQASARSISSEGKGHAESRRSGGLNSGKRSLRSSKKIRNDSRATKTVGIILGAFIVCWCPFFTVYLIGAFCEHCISSELFSVFFWLGYCNSFVNPCIYALFSKDFRDAFKKILCRCRLQDDRQKKFRLESAITSMFKSINMNSQPLSYLHQILHGNAQKTDTMGHPGRPDTRERK
ncbi:putative G-protein coupled receptor No9 [Nymphon striatum]|nr:putative G-protein coupled receptor No9 [Nymphon striatum]